LVKRTAEFETREPLTPDYAEKEPVVPYYVKACGLGITAYLIGIHLWTWVFNVRYFLAGRADFRAMYAAGYLVRTGHRHQLYEYPIQARFQDLVVGPSNTPLPFNHLAYESLLFVPLSVFTYRTAYFIFLFANLFLLGICFVMLRSWTRNLAKVYRWLPVALFVAYLPIAATLIQGQDSILLLTIFTGAFVLMERNQSTLAGALVGLAMFKFQLAVPIALIFLFWRGWRFVAGFVATSAVVLCVSSWLVGFAQMKTYAHLLSTMSSASGSAYFPRVATPNQMPNLRGLIFGLANHNIPASLVLIAIAISSAVLLLWAATRQNIQRTLSALLVAVTVAALVSYHLNLHDLSVMFLPILSVLDHFVLSEADGSAMDKWTARSAALAFCAPVAESFFPDHLYLASLPILIFLAFLLKDPIVNKVQPRPIQPAN
jgi:hypothetical protein